MEIKVVHPKAELIAVTQPIQSSARLDGRPLEDEADLLRFIYSMPYQKEASRTVMEKFALRKKHTSGLEFIDYTFTLTMSRTALAQITRHRMASYMVESQRYVDYTKHTPTIVVMPDWLDKDVELLKDKAVSDFTLYSKLIDAGWKREKARLVLPPTTATHMVCKFNLRSFLNFVVLRSDLSDMGKHAQEEIRMLATGMAFKVFDQLELLGHVELALELIDFIKREGGV